MKFFGLFGYAMAVWHGEVIWLIVGDIWQMQESEPDQCYCSVGMSKFCSSFHDFFAVPASILWFGSIESCLVQFTGLP